MNLNFITTLLMRKEYKLLILCTMNVNNSNILFNIDVKCYELYIS